MLVGFYGHTNDGIALCKYNTADLIFAGSGNDPKRLLHLMVYDTRTRMRYFVMNDGFKIGSSTGYWLKPDIRFVDEESEIVLRDYKELIKYFKGLEEHIESKN